MENYIEYGGGLGDVIHQIFTAGSYNFLKNNKARVAIISHNPYVKEIFENFPNKENLNITQYEYWLVENDKAMRALHNLPSTQNYIPTGGTVNFYPNEADLQIIDSYKSQDFILISAAAGMPERNIPEGILNKILEKIPLKTVSVGRTYERGNRYEISTSYSDNLINKLSVPGTIELLRYSRGIVTCHSALNIAAWHLNIPQFLLYPDSVFNTHVKNKDQWAFGIDFPNTIHCLFSQYTDDYINKFLKII